MCEVSVWGGGVLGEGFWIVSSFIVNLFLYLGNDIGNLDVL